jgi:hypothetical protein
VSQVDFALKTHGWQAGDLSPATEKAASIRFENARLVVRGFIPGCRKGRKIAIMALTHNG